MRVIAWGINYAPELTGIGPYNTALCEWLARHGHDIRMVTAFRYYPEWRKNHADRRRLFRTESLNGVRVHRCWHFVPARGTAAKRIIHEASFVFASLLRTLILPRPDVYVVVSPPLLLGAAAWLISRIKRAPFVFHVQDLQPDAALGLGMLKPGVFTRALYRLEAFAYRGATRVSGISGGMTRAFQHKGVLKEKIALLPNGVVIPSRLPAGGAFRRRHGISKEVFLAVYAGNLGMKQGLDVLLDAAPLLPVAAIHLIICGDGARREHLSRRVASERFRNVLLLPLQAPGDYEEMLVDADCCLITQQRGTGAFFFPSKLLVALAFAKAIVSVADEESELARAVKAGHCGVNARPENPASIAKSLLALAGDRTGCAAMGESGRRFAEQFAMARVLEEFERVLQQTAQDVSKQSAAEKKSARRCAQR